MARADGQAALQHDIPAGAWRGWWAFGTGVLDEWMCQVIRPMFWVHDPSAPTSIMAETFDDDSIRFAGQKLQWDSAAMRFTNVDEANAFVKPPSWSGWELA